MFSWMDHVGPVRSQKWMVGKLNFLFGPFACFQGRLQLVLRSGSGCSSSNGVFVGMSDHETVKYRD